MDAWWLYCSSDVYFDGQVRGSARVVDQDPEGKYEALQKYGRDLTIAARDGKLDPVRISASQSQSDSRPAPGLKSI